MSRKILIAGNWKMNGLKAEVSSLAKGVSAKYNNNSAYEMLICPPFTLVANAVDTVKGSGLKVGAQDCHFNTNGAHTADISPLMLKDAGAEYVILGHSERRADHGESDSLVNKKAKAVYEAGLKAIICIGESDEQNKAGKAVEVNQSQVAGSVPDNATAENTVIAYEPIWAIGTGRIPTSDDIQNIHAEIRKALASKLGQSVADGMRILYGGSMKPTNAEEILALADVDGGLIGGASLKVDDFMGIGACVK